MIDVPRLVFEWACVIGLSIIAFILFRPSPEPSRILPLQHPPLPVHEDYGLSRVVHNLSTFFDWGGKTFREEL